MSKGLEIDFETRSAVDLRKRGVYNYMDSPTTEPLMASYQIDDGPLKRWRPPEPCPPDIVAHIETGGTMSAHNAQFERLLWQRVLTPRYGWPVLRTEQCRCTAATAAAMALPRDLAGLGAALGLQVQKDTAGKQLIRKFSMPRRPRKGEDPNALLFNESQDFPEDFERFHDYCDDDVRAEAGADRRMVPLSDAEQNVWLLTERINDRGIRIDRRSAQAALALAEKAKKDLDREMRIVTGGYVGGTTQPGKLVEWVQNQGVAMDSAQKAEVESLLDCDDLPEHVRRAVEIRQEAAKTSVSKLKTMLDRASDDDRVRGGFVYHQASTGRTQSTGANWNNLPRPRKLYDDEKPDTELLFEAFRSEDPALLSLLYGKTLGRPLHLISDAIRGFIWAAPGHELVQADFSNIEGNVISWSAGEQWKLAAIHELNADPSLPDMYRRTAAGILGLTTDVVTKKHWARQAVGKPAELGLSYGGGVMAFLTFAKAYGVKLDPIAPNIIAQADEDRIEKATKRYEGQARRGLSGTAELSREAWIACEIIKLGWRSQNSAIVQSWKDLETAVRRAVEEPGRVTSAAKVDYKVAAGFLWARLPSGRCLAYGAPKLRQQVWARTRLVDGTFADSEVMDRETAERMAARGDAKIEGSTSDKVTVLGVDSKTKKWRRYGLYGGLLAENNTQAIARDLLVNGMWKAEAAGYPIIMTVYDEIVAEVPRGFGDQTAFEKMICELPEWAAGIPLTAGGWAGKRYRKD